MESTDHSTSAQSAPALATHVERHARESSEGHRVRFLDPSERTSFRASLGATTLIVEVDIVGVARGGLGVVIDRAIEDALTTPPGLGVGEATLDRTRSDRTLGDQLYRARLQGASKLAIFVQSLEPLLTPMRVLESVDAAMLRFYALATKTRPIDLVLEARDEDIGAYTDPVPLRAALEPRATTAPAASTMPPASPSHRYIPLPRVGAVDVTVASEDPDDAVTTRPPPVIVDIAAPEPPEANYRERLAELARVRGPQPLAGLETAFVTSYVPLSFGIATGRVSRDESLPYFEFREGFERAYREGYPTLGQRTRRPKMVCDAPALAQAKARSHSARAAQLLVVDALRFDMGVRLARRLAELANGRASLAGREVLWALLPTTTERQMVGLVRGTSALSSTASIDASTESMRGRSAEVVRRIRFGARDLHRLDCVAADIADMEANPRNDAAQVYEELKTSADRTAEIISAYIATLPSRTLLYVLGDHGFTVSHDGRVHQGGGSPEEVMVPALAYMVGDLH